MAEIIDCTKCAFYNNGKCDNPNGMACNCANNTVCYFKELKRLEQENAELKAENKKLREDYIKLSQQKDLDNARWQKRCTDLHIEDKAKADKYWLVLQEIKELINTCMEFRACERCKFFKMCDKDLEGCILSLITKAGEE